MKRLATITAVALLTAAAPSRADAQTVTKVDSWNKLLGFSFFLAGRDLNGIGLNGDSLEGKSVASVWLDDGYVNGVPIGHLELDKTRFRGADVNGHPINHHDLVGAELVAQLDDGSTLPLYVASMARHPDKGYQDVFRYEVLYASLEGWQPLCGESGGDPIAAIPLEGRWSYESGVPGGGDHIDDPWSFTFACEDMVLAKCVLAGYKPWRTTLSCAKGEGCAKGDLADHHQACTRALRGDYFGDGTAHTVDGTAINLYDGLGIRTDADAWAIEAEWSSEGAVCVAPGQTGRAEGTPALDSLVADDCGASSYFLDGTLLMTELEP